MENILSETPTANSSEIQVKKTKTYNLYFKKYPFSKDASGIINDPNNTITIYQHEEEEFPVKIELTASGEEGLENMILPNIKKISGSIPSLTPYNRDISNVIEYEELRTMSYLCIGDNNEQVPPNILDNLRQQPLEKASSTGLNAPFETFIKFAIKRFNAYLKYAKDNGTTTRILMINTVKLIEALFGYDQYDKERDFYKFMNEDPDLWLNATCVGIRNDEILNITSSVSPQPVFKSKNIANKFWQFKFSYMAYMGNWNDVQLQTKAEREEDVDIYEWNMLGDISNWGDNFFVWPQLSGGKRKTYNKKSKMSKKVKKNKRKSKKIKPKKH